MREADRLFEKLQHIGWGRDECEMYAPLTQQINELKKEKGISILAHSYQTPDIIFGIADHIGDSLGLSQVGMELKEETILFCGVRFMAETAKILSPEKTILHSAPDAGCSLSESITAQDVIDLKNKHPKAKAVCYVNTSAAVKAECDACCTSSNVVKVIEGQTSQEVIFVPDALMAQNVAKLTSKTLISWDDGKCIVHDQFKPEVIQYYKELNPDMHILVHTECAPDVVSFADSAGSTEHMKVYLEQHPEAKQVMLVTECGMGDRLQIEFPDRQFMGTCVLCPYMKRIGLDNVLQTIIEPTDQQIISLDNLTMDRARSSLEAMLQFV